MASTKEQDTYVSPTSIRHNFSVAMSSIYKAEVPLYSNLLSLVSEVNASVLSKDEALNAIFKATNQLSRLHYERHGAIRLGTAHEMATMARFLAIMGMQPVGYYDLSQAALPMHATCFRCVDLESLTTNPFRLFVSLLRPELISPGLRPKVYEILERRSIFQPRALELIALYESQGGLTAAQADELVTSGLETFKWRSQATIPLEAYQDLLAESPLLADVVAFEGPHINHLTPRTLDIDLVQSSMSTVGIPMKDVIEGPPARKCAILLRQTSFKALEEKVYFPASGDGTSKAENVLGSHKARFGEVEQRGAALTQKGRDFYDHLIQETWKRGVSAADAEAYAEVFAAFPDEWETLRTQDLAWFRYFVIDGQAHSETTTEESKPTSRPTLESLIADGKIGFEPFVYEDFLPLSAAGIFASNLGDGQAGSKRNSVDGVAMTGEGLKFKAQMEQALGATITDEMEVYRRLQERSLEECREVFDF